jgi:hypothetical protein
MTRTGVVGDIIDAWCQKNGTNRDRFAGHVGVSRGAVDKMAEEAIPGEFRGPGPGELGSVTVPVFWREQLAKKYGADHKRFAEALR